MEKVQWISIDKKQNGLKYSKNDKSSTLPRNNCWEITLKQMLKVRSTKQNVAVYQCFTFRSAAVVIISRMQLVIVERHMFTSAQLFLVFRFEYTLCTCSCIFGKKQVPFTMAIGNGELMLERFPKNSGMGTAKTK